MHGQENIKFPYDVQSFKLSSQGLTFLTPFITPLRAKSTAISSKQEGIVTFMTTNKTRSEYHLINMMNFNWPRNATQ